MCKAFEYIMFQVNREDICLLAEDYISKGPNEKSLAKIYDLPEHELIAILAELELPALDGHQMIAESLCDFVRNRCPDQCLL